MEVNQQIGRGQAQGLDLECENLGGLTTYPGTTLPLNVSEVL